MFISKLAKYQPCWIPSKPVASDRYGVVTRIDNARGYIYVRMSRSGRIVRFSSLSVAGL